MNQKHNHKENKICEHKDVKLCKDCDVVYCVSCPMEWKKESNITIAPYIPQTAPMPYPFSNPPFINPITNPPYFVTCDSAQGADSSRYLTLNPDGVWELIN